MARLRRYDSGELKASTELPNGWLRADAFVTRAGVFLYRNADGSERRELRHPDDVFAPESLATLAMVPITDGHPSTPLDATNARSLSVGHVGEVIERADGDLVKASLMLVDAPAITAVRSGDRRELSCGYSAEVIDEAGTYDGEPYTHRQKGILYNHLAIVPAGRAGPLVRVRIDGEERLVPVTDGAVQVRADAAPAVVTAPPATPPARTDSIAHVEQSQEIKSHSGGTVALKKFRKDGMTIELEEADVPALEAFIASLQSGLAAAKQSTTDAEKKATEAEAAATTAKSEADTAKAKADAAEKAAEKLRTDLAAATDPKALAARVNARVELVARAKPVLGAEAKLDGLTDFEVRRAVAEKLTGEKFDGKSETYVEARFDSEITHAEKGRGLTDLRPNGTGETGNKSRLDKADDDLLAHNRTSHLPPERK